MRRMCLPLLPGLIVLLLAGCGESPADLTLEENVRRAQQHQARGEHAEAIPYYTEALDREPRNFMLLNNRAAAYTAVQKYDEALADLTQAIRFSKEKSAKTFINRSAIYFNAGLLDDALTDINAAIELEPDNAEAYWIRGTIHHFQKQADASQRDLQKARDLGFQPANEAGAAKS